MKSIRIRAIVLLGLLGILVSELVGLGMVGASVLHTNEQLNTKNSAIDDGSSCGLENSVGSYSQCPNAPFAIPAEYVHASYGGTPSWLHPGVDFTDRTTDSNKARQPTSLACPGDGVWDLGVPDEAPVYAAYDGFVDGFHYANEVLLGIYIRHENVTVNDQTYPVICTYYEHMANASTGETTVFPQFRTWNAPVQKGDQIGRIGNGGSGGATFTHLHFGIGIGLYSGHCSRPYTAEWYTDPSPFLGFNANQDNGASRYCYPVDCPSDATPPDTSITSGPSGSININDVTFGWTGSDNQTPTSSLQYSYKLDGYSDWSSWTGNTNKTYNNLPDGSYTFRVKARDEAGNEDPTPATRSFQVDTQPPNTSITSGPSGCVGNNEVTFGWTGSDDRTSTSDLQYRYRLDGYTDWSVWTGNTSKTYNNLPNRSYTFRVKAKDKAGNVDPTPATRSFAVDTRKPSNPTSTQSNCGARNNLWQNICNDPSFTWSGASDHGGCAGIEEYEYRWQTQLGTIIKSDTAHSPSFSPQDPVSGGVYKLRLRTKDALGHWSSWMDAFVLRYDNTAPTVTLQINGGAETTNQTSVLLSPNADDNLSGVAAMRISNNNLIWPDWQPYPSAGSGQALPWTLPALNRRTHTIYVQVRDRAGNESTIASDSITLDLYPPMPHSDNYRICADVIDVGGSAGVTSTSYSLVSAIGQPWGTGATANTSSGFGERAGFLSSITGCLPISFTVTSEFTVTQWVVASGGNLRGSASYRLGDTTGQAAASGGNAFTSTSYVLSSGFWAQITGTVPPTTTQPTPVPITPTLTPTPGPAPTPQPSGFGVSINDGALYTDDPDVTVRTWAPNVTHQRLSNDGGYSDESWMSYQITTTWVLSTYSDHVMPRYVYAWFRDTDSNVYGAYFDDIIYDPVAPKGQVTILGGETATVTLWLEAWDDNSGVEQMRVGEQAVGTGTAWLPFDGIAWQPFTNIITWVLQSNVVYAQFQDRAGNLSPIYGTNGSIYWPDGHSVYLPLMLLDY